MKRFVLAFLFVLVSFKTVANDALHVAYSIDNNYVVYALVSISSVLKNNKSNSKYSFWILDNGISEENKKKIRTYIEDRDQKVNFLSPYQHPLYQAYSPLIKHIYKFAEFSHVSYVSFMRLFIPSLLPSDVHKLLYIDGDTVVNKDLKELFQTDLKGLPIGMARDISPNLRYICGINMYHNAGVILIDMDKWNQNKLLERIITSFRNNPEKYKRYGEQDLLNCELSNEIMTLDSKWNNQIARHISTANVNNTGIFHYISGVKPWNSFGLAAMHKPYRTYLHYWNFSGLRWHKYKAIINKINERFPSQDWNTFKNLLNSRNKK